MKGRRENKSFQEWCQWKCDRHNERGNEGAYDGCVLNPYMEIEE
jgi:hypothetical protein